MPGGEFENGLLKLLVIIKRCIELLAEYIYSVPRLFGQRKGSLFIFFSRLQNDIRIAFTENVVVDDYTLRY